ncbi:protein arginine N-methyltransferase 3 [Cladophialophora yegresii CBS 114405]|uniref:type I protein arginine methyltransferase n=1 Tax=Cladophialophora yegresii CBS 114405 TaxID=1182544 RepID=W9VYH4_9EURO|nr:protein arginine N-methyltransferase 3 [Cladophialophora yegresii CBS 114405]EXJ57301.1 protein arginine N-methyltransferase 3 [Cladophialophora yegresii CBS 114405]
MTSRRDPQPDSASEVSSTSDPLDTRNDEGWEDVENDEETVAVTSLFDEQAFPSAQAMLAYCRDSHGFDIWKLRQEFALDYLGLVRLVNYIRSQVKAGNLHPDVSSKSCFEDETYLKPALEDDALLYSLDDVFEESANPAPIAEVEQLREQLASLQAQFSAYREQVQDAMLAQLEQSPSSKGETASPSAPRQPPTRAEDLDTGYFQSYSYNAIHESMIKDRVRTDAYRDFIYDHKHLFKDKVVLDVGCGTAILSMFCARAGAKLVLAVDNSDIIDKARENVFKNGLQDVVKCLRGKIEEITLPVPKVDVVVSEWMGYCLLYESMLDSVIYARDTYLAPDGLMVPSHASLRIAPLADSDLKASHIDFWRDVYGFDMTAMLERAHEEVLVRVADEQELASESFPFLELDLHRTKVDDLTFTKPFKATWREGFKLLEGFVIWFDIIFGTSRTQNVTAGLTAAEAKKAGLISFSTGPHSEATHWQQGIFLIKDPADEFGAGDKVAGEVKYLKKQGQERSIDIEISWAKSDGAKDQVKKQMWVVD